MKLFGKTSKMALYQAGLAAAIVAFAFPELASAQNMQATASSLVSAMHDMPTILSGCAYLGGGMMCMGGANKIKMHAENPTQTRLSDGVVRVGVGGLMAGMPTVIPWMQSTLAIGNSTPTFQSMGKISLLLQQAFFG